MLGEPLGEVHFQPGVTRVLPPEGQGPRMEITLQGGGTLLGVATTDMATYVSALRPDGTLFGEGQGVTMTADGGVASWVGQGVGRPTGRGMGVTFRGAVYYYSASPSLARLNGVAAIFEYEVEADGKATSKLWEWK